MSSFALTILGSSSAVPRPDRFTTAHVLNAHERFFLIDCGEGTQIQLRRFRIRFSRIHHIFISHLHGDHFFGLPGLLSSFQLMGRKKELHVYGPAGLKTILTSLYEQMGDQPGYPIIFHPVDPQTSGIILETSRLTVVSFPLNHKKPATGFLFREKEGERNARPGCRSYAFVSDTRYDHRIISYIQGVDLLYHEATYLDELKERARITGHSTAREAGQIAREAGVRKLVIGHYSARYRDPEVLLQEARAEFPDTEPAEDGKQFVV